MSGGQTAVCVQLLVWIYSTGVLGNSFHFVERTYCIYCFQIINDQVVLLLSTDTVSPPPHNHNVEFSNMGRVQLVQRGNLENFQ